MSSAVFRWVATEPLSLARLLEQHGLDAALREGRVFVDAKRASTGVELPAGSVVEVFAPRPGSAIEILHERGEVFAVHKPAALPTEPDHSGADCVLTQLAARLRVDVSGLFALSRLDVGVSGVLLVTLGARSRQRLLEQRAGGLVGRRYVALTAAAPDPPEGEWSDALGGAGSGRRAVGGRGAQPARSRYRTLAQAATSAPGGVATALLALSPVTGRTHQLRVHASAHGCAILGDRKYGGVTRLTGADGSVRALPQILLHALFVEWQEGSARRRVVSTPAPALVDTWQVLGGDLSAFQRALD
jgi:tRNA pseudouridine32 synthase / 23S rRNA pseudouridine746 synthase